MHSILHQAKKRSSLCNLTRMSSTRCVRTDYARIRVYKVPPCAQYHTGFRSQASTWPSHPLDIIITSLRTLPDRSLIVDLGCGDARLAQDLAFTSLKVLSYDLVKKNEWVQVAQCSAALPLPKEIADCVVCCLSLMGTDWLGQIRESARLLRKGSVLGQAFLIRNNTDW